MIELIIADLDNTLWDTLGFLGEVAIEKAVTAMEEAGLPERKGEQFLNKIYEKNFSRLLEELDVEESIAETGKDAYEVTSDKYLEKIELFDDVEVLENLPQRKVLVTSGKKDFQEEKIERLGIRDLFEKIVIVNSFSKEEEIDTLVEEYGVSPGEVLVLGDNPSSEIRAGNILGCHTVQINRRRKQACKADYSIDSLEELPGILSEINNK